METSSFSKLAGFTGVCLCWITCPAELVFSNCTSVKQVLRCNAACLQRYVFARPRVCNDVCLQQCVFARQRVCNNALMPQCVFATMRICVCVCKCVHLCKCAYLHLLYACVRMSTCASVRLCVYECDDLCNHTKA